MTTRITEDCRRESYEKVKPTIGKRHEDILEILAKSQFCMLDGLPGLTASQISNYLFTYGDTKYNSRNNAAPRLTELEKLGRIKVIGKRFNCSTGRNESVYALVRETNG
jgi:hypothetical protein